MNLYDAYMTARDRASAPVAEEVLAVFSPAPTAAPRAPSPRPPMGEPEGCGCDGGNGRGSCGHDGACGCMPSLAMVYAKPHGFHTLYEGNEGLARGTIFRELDMPFTGGGRK